MEQGTRPALPKTNFKGDLQNGRHANRRRIDDDAQD